MIFISQIIEDHFVKLPVVELFRRLRNILSEKQKILLNDKDKPKRCLQENSSHLKIQCRNEKQFYVISINS